LNLKILVACEESQVVTKELRKLGHEAFSCDLKPCSGGHPEWHLTGCALEQIQRFDWDMMIAFPDCTYLTVTANKWLKDQPARKSGALVGAERRKAREDAVSFFMALAGADIPRIAIENPVGVMSTRWRKPNQIICPTMFGHKEPKKTCLWTKGLPELVPTKIVEPEYHTTKSGKRMPLWYAYADKSQGQAKRAEIRSKTFSGIAKAMAEQWAGNAL
jgi:hypothetical protein